MSTSAARLDQVRQQLRVGHSAHARALLDALLASDPNCTEALYLSGMLNATLGANLSALADFDAALRLMPGLPPILFNRGLVLFRLERTSDALTDFLALSHIQPSNPDVWINIGIIHLREGRPGHAIESLRRADLLAPNSPVVLRTMANALREAGQHLEALALHRKVIAATPADAAVLTDYALSLLSVGEFADAREHYQRALAADPADQTALAGLYMTSNELGDESVASTLMDYSTLLGHRRLSPNDEVDLQALRDAILSHGHLVWEPAGRSTRAGKQSPMLDLAAGSTFEHFRRMLTRHVEQHIQTIADDPRLKGHPWLAAMPRHWRLQSWITILEQGGQQTPHIHPAGWLSGVFYVDTGKPDSRGHGNLVFGNAPGDLPLHRSARLYDHQPDSGQLVLFPSYFFHNTVPYTGAGPRISLAFDLIPDQR